MEEINDDDCTDYKLIKIPTGYYPNPGAIAKYVTRGLTNHLLAFNGEGNLGDLIRITTHILEKSTFLNTISYGTASLLVAFDFMKQWETNQHFTIISCTLVLQIISSAPEFCSINLSQCIFIVTQSNIKFVAIHKSLFWVLYPFKGNQWNLVTGVAIRLTISLSIKSQLIQLKLKCAHQMAICSPLAKTGLLLCSFISADKGVNGNISI